MTKWTERIFDSIAYPMARDTMQAIVDEKRDDTIPDNERLFPDFVDPVQYIEELLKRQNPHMHTLETAWLGRTAFESVISGDAQMLQTEGAR